MKKTIQKAVAISIGMIALLGFTFAAGAHVVVKPNQAGVGAFQTFTMGVPVEKDIPTVGLKLLIPAGLHYVSPNVKQGWYVSVKKTGTGENAVVTEIDWTGGYIPAGQRDDFYFSAQVPTTTSELNWKAYQTYQDGTVVSWDHDPAGGMEVVSNAGPYSVTHVVNDLTPAPPSSSATNAFAFTLSIVALAISSVALASARKRTNV